MKKMIPRVKDDSELLPQNFYLAQALSGKGCFGSYLSKIGKRSHSECRCGEEEETPAHIFEDCRLYTKMRDLGYSIKRMKSRFHI